MSKATHMNPQQEKRHELRQRAIVEAAATIFGRQGIHATTLEQIGREVGLSKASLYYYVKNKEEIIALVLEAVLHDINAYAKSVTDVQAPYLEQLKMRAWSHIAGGQSPSGTFIVMNLDSLNRDRATARMMRTHEEPARQLLQQAIDAGELRAIDITVAIKILYSSLNAIARWHKPEYSSIRDSFETTWDIFVNGIGA